ncbi:MAG: hypothetical protein Q4F72_03800 [Desulfovibrionaceae bacterium]|nr:hypothetical protein [Desulfovibrionaceae bacterium]
MEISQKRVCDIRLGIGDSELDAEMYNFLLENNIMHGMNPGLVASREQLAFMVAMEPEQFYVPCADSVFFDLLRDEFSEDLKNEYRRTWRKTMHILSSLPVDRETRRRLRTFCRKRMRKVVLFHDTIPSRLMKRLTSVLLSSDGGVSDPWQARRAELTALQKKVLESAEFRTLLDEMPALPKAGLAETRRAMDRVEFARLACLAAHAKSLAIGPGDMDRARGCLARAEAAFEPVWDRLSCLHNGRHATIMLLCDAQGGALYDLELARFFIERGHRVIYAVKDDFYFYAPTLADMREDPVLVEAMAGAHVCLEANLTKNELLKRLREHRLIVIGDGTRERLNLLRVSVTFARAWKEADLVLAHGWRLAETLLGTSHSFTRDILCFSLPRDRHREGGDTLSVAFRPHAPSVRKFTEQDLQRHADGIISGMREASREGRPVIFYSCIIGSIPGQTATALRLANAIVGDIAQRLPNAFIINPAGHFVDGMDGDDLMYMWERVQRSGFINIWYFQTAEDIERGFEILGEPMPEVWTGKDATYSTGCTKEMRIALEVQKRNREMQILGPDPSFFFRRGEYGVGKYFDATLVRR